MSIDYGRRGFLYQSLSGIGGMALLDFLNGDLAAASLRT